MFSAEEVINQLGGFGKLGAMINARNFGKGDNYLQFKFSGNKKMNLCKIRLNSLDEYEVEFWKVGSTDAKKVQETAAWAGNLKQRFEEVTGLYLSL